ncbi:unnamed protein product [Lupinus luteus]|uniref:60S ribosomal protein L17 n=1 Tax=Lupinus luteus TaxID=3873 RepID=A0AAV1WXU0_LUPLU
MKVSLLALHVIVYQITIPLFLFYYINSPIFLCCYLCILRGDNFRVHLKNTRETTFSTRKLPLVKAKRYLEDVLTHKQVIPFRRFCRGVGKTTQAKNRHSNGKSCWPMKSTKFILDLLKNAESNAEVKGLVIDALYISHIHVNQAERQRQIIGGSIFLRICQGQEEGVDPNANQSPRLYRPGFPIDVFTALSVHPLFHPFITRHVSGRIQTPGSSTRRFTM